MKLILSQHRGISKGLPNVFLFQIREIGDDLRRRHAVGHEVDDMGHGDADAVYGGPAGQHVRILGDAIERVRHVVLSVIVAHDDDGADRPLFAAGPSSIAAFVAAAAPLDRRPPLL